MTCFFLLHVETYMIRGSMEYGNASIVGSPLRVIREGLVPPNSLFCFYNGMDLVFFSREPTV